MGTRGYLGEANCSNLDVTLALYRVNILFFSHHGLKGTKVLIRTPPPRSAIAYAPNYNFTCLLFALILVLKTVKHNNFYLLSDIQYSQDEVGLIHMLKTSQIWNSDVCSFRFPRIHLCNTCDKDGRSVHCLSVSSSCTEIPRSDKEHQSYASFDYVAPHASTFCPPSVHALSLLLPGGLKHSFGHQNVGAAVSKL